MKGYIFIVGIILLNACQSNPVYRDILELSDDNLQTSFTGTKGLNQFTFDKQNSPPFQSYSLYCSEDSSSYDPYKWTVKGTHDGKNWIILDERKEQMFCSRFQEITGVINTPSNYRQYMLEVSTQYGDSVKIADIVFHEDNLLKDWNDFHYPKVNFQVEDPEVKGAYIYNELVQDPDSYIQYHARKVAEILYYTSLDSMPNIETINYTLKEYDGISAKSGAPPAISIVYSTKHIENSANQSLYKLDFETRGVLYHELVHGYQFEPKGIGSYSTNKAFWACIEGIADAVRAEAGYFDFKTRKPGGNWMDGYRTTGFFIQWLTTKDPNAIRKFHNTVKELDNWSFDKAIKNVFGDESSIELMWEEYQTYLIKQTNE